MVKSFQGVTGTERYRLGEARDLINVALLQVSQVVLRHSSPVYLLTLNSQIAVCLVRLQSNSSY